MNYIINLLIESILIYKLVDKGTISGNTAIGLVPLNFRHFNFHYEKNIVFINGYKGSDTHENITFNRKKNSTKFSLN